MKILMLNYEFPPLGGGGSPVSYEIAKGYIRLSHKVDVVTMGFKELPEYEEKDGINIYRVKCLRSKKEICHPWEQLTYIYSAKKFLKLHLAKNQYDINHTHFIIPTGVISLWLKKRYNLSYIITTHGSDVLGYNERFKFLYPFLKKPWKEIIKNANLIISPSKFLQEKIKNITNEGNFTVIPNGVNKNKFKPMKKERKILIVARLTKNKGVQNIIDALKPIHQELKQKKWEIDIVGEGPYRKFLENKSKEENLNDIIKFHGWLENKSKKLHELYGKAKIFISASWFENISIALLEALASGCHVLATNVGGNPEVVEKNNLFELNNKKQLTKKIKDLMNSKIKISKLSRKFDWDNNVKKYLKAINKFGIKKIAKSYLSKITK